MRRDEMREEEEGEERNMKERNGDEGNAKRTGLAEEEERGGEIKGVRDGRGGGGREESKKQERG